MLRCYLVCDSSRAGDTSLIMTHAVHSEHKEVQNAAYLSGIAHRLLVEQSVRSRSKYTPAKAGFSSSSRVAAASSTGARRATSNSTQSAPFGGYHLPFVVPTSLSDSSRMAPLKLRSCFTPRGSNPAPLALQSDRAWQDFLKNNCKRFQALRSAVDLSVGCSRQYFQWRRTGPECHTFASWLRSVALAQVRPQALLSLLGAGHSMDLRVFVPAYTEDRLAVRQRNGNLEVYCEATVFHNFGPVLIVYRTQSTDLTRAEYDLKHLVPVHPTEAPLFSHATVPAPR
jgi:hypothetical protein